MEPTVRRREYTPCRLLQTSTQKSRNGARRGRRAHLVLPGLCIGHTSGAAMEPLLNGGSTDWHRRRQAARLAIAMEPAFEGGIRRPTVSGQGIQ
jgi:hypothetical protein